LVEKVKRRQDDATEMGSRSGWQGKGTLEELMRERIRATIESIIDEELEGALGAARSRSTITRSLAPAASSAKRRGWFGNIGAIAICVKIPAARRRRIVVSRRTSAGEVGVIARRTESSSVSSVIDAITRSPRRPERSREAIARFLHANAAV